jgi:hypothetical protein
MIDTLAPICGYQQGWCIKGPKASCWKLPTKCRYYSRNHPAFPTITKNKNGELTVMDTMRYDTRFATRQEYDECEHGIIKVDSDGFCETCRIPTHFWDTNVKLHVCSNRCRVVLYKRLEKEANG